MAKDNFYETQETPPKALLVGEPKKDLTELIGLVSTLGCEIAYAMNLNRLEVQPAYGMGSGKAQEISAFAKNLDCDYIIFDFNLEPTKQRNWEKLSGLSCFDRQEVIIRIFASRARTKEAVLQVELARLQYSLPRLAHLNQNFSRQRGGSYGSKGSGETKLELDSRKIRYLIQKKKEELKKIEKIRTTQRKSRINLPSCALVGYTNAGKSSLLNALTDSEAYVENQLFATLDPLTRKWDLIGNSVLLTDTVGFISNLPHSLIDAFKSTLEESVFANLLLIILDASDEKAEKHYETVCKVLDEIGAKENKRLLVLNKCDISEKSDIIDMNITKFSEQDLYPPFITTSCRTKMGFDTLREKVKGVLYDN